MAKSRTMRAITLETMKFRFRGAPLYFPVVEWAISTSNNRKISGYDRGICRIRCNWSHDGTLWWTGNVLTEETNDEAR